MADWYRTVAPDTPDRPKSDFGENFITALLLWPVRTIVGIMSAEAIDREAGPDGENVDQVIANYERKFIYERGRRRRD